ncbi:M61 family peptidase [Oleiagrimonas sp.]|jgi:predicted metalloprotease with PDZ domain|uniref:M61 family metallopeptidase n=1 Tax=Oleiagrimonas sp. TaxID=2010330 RepID=UPI00260CF1D1|nr:M61 family peptidase [Oleiagrimonas sp.]MDA3915076.1 M61 family peptidase [Oleiagrimonas sp.]
MSRSTLRRLLYAFALTCVFAAPCAFAAVASASSAPVKHPSDQPYPGGMLTLDLDLTRAPDRIFEVHETIPVAHDGSFALYYPKWIPGEHAPSGPINNIAGLIIKANGQQLHWRRDLADMFTLYVDVPKGVRKLDLQFQFLSPGGGGQFGASPSTSNDLADVEFNQVAFYPAGYYSRRVMIEPTVILPRHWKFATALDVASQSGNVVHFKPVSFNNFVDSPLIAGKHFKRVDLAPGAKVPVHLNIVGDSAADVNTSTSQVREHRNLVTQILALFGSHHYHHYDFLLTLSNHVGHFGLEHHQSSDDRLAASYLTDDQMYMRAATLMPHEWVHSWNGKFRRPADLWTPNFNMVKRDDMLWVYEGLTDYWAGVLTTRSGLWTADQYHDAIASIAAAMAHRTGRQWRSLQDTADAARLTYAGASGWANWRRRTDFYPEGQLLWLDVDTKIRQLSHGRHSLDDFAHAFYGMDNGSDVTRTYTYQDVIDSLNKVQPYDWNQFLRSRLDYTGDKLPEHGLARGGWKVVYTDKPSAYDKASQSMGRGTDLDYSAGFSVSSNGHVYDVQWKGPAFRAGLVPGMEITAVDGKSFTSKGLKQAVTRAVGSTAPIRLLVKNIDRFRSLEIDYHGGLKYPHLKRIKGTPDRLDRILKAR